MKEDFKNIIKQTVDNHSDDINPDMIWAGIENKLGKKKQRFTGFWMLGGLSLLAALLVFVFVWSSADNNKSTVENHVEAKQVNTDIILDEIEENVAVIKDNVSIKEGIDEVVMQSEVIVNNKDEADVSKNEIIEIDKANLINKVQEKVIDNQSKLIADKAAAATKLFQSADLIVLSDNTMEEAKGQSLLAIPGLKGNQDGVNVKSRVLANSNKLQIIETNLFPLLSRTISTPSHDAFVFDSPAYVNDEKNFQLLSGIEFYSGLSFGSKSVSDMDQSYAQLRNDSEKLLEQWSAGLRLDVVDVMDFKLQSGIKYSMITDRLQLVKEYSDLNEYTYVNRRLVGDAIVVIDSMTVVDTMSQKSYTLEQYNSQRIISVPLEVSFGKSFGNLELGFGFGVDVNYQLADTHVILDQDGVASVNKVGGKWVSPSFSGALLLGYSLSENWSIASRLHFRNLSLSDHESISTLNSNYKLYGLELGIKRRLFR